jgi:signal transduction histidine kinase
MEDFDKTKKFDNINIASALKAFNADIVNDETTQEEHLEGTLDYKDLAALNEVNQAVNSTLILDDILGIVMAKSVKLFDAERGFLMLLDDVGKLQLKTAHNIKKEQLHSEDMRISTTIANKVVKTGQAVYVSDALSDDRFSQKASIIDLNIRSAMCVPLKLKTKIIGVLYLDNSSKANIFIKQDLILFEMFAAQAALAIHNARLYTEVLELQKYQQNIIAYTPIGLLVVDTCGIITAVNEAAEKIFLKIGWNSFPPEKPGMVGLKIVDVIPDRYQRDFIEALSAENAKPTDISRLNIPYRNEEHVLKIRFCPFDNYHGEKAGHIVLIDDITEQVVLEQYLILSEKLIGKGEMAAAIGHELNNYLTVISTNAQLLALNLAQGKFDTLKNKIEVIVKNVDRIKRFTDGLMDFSTLESKPVTYDLNRLIEDLVFFVKPQPKFKRVSFDVNVPNNLPQVYIDVSQLHQVFLNLLINSADVLAEFKNGQGTISIAAHLSSNKKAVYVAVSDNGPGIAESVLQKVFEPHITTKKAGHGLGLSTCLRIINNHGGSIKAYNSPVGGAVFEIVIPISPGHK